MARWLRSRRDDVQDFADALARRKVIRQLGEVAVELLTDFTPAGLEHLIASGGSIVEGLEGTITPEQQQEYARKAQGYAEVVSTITGADMLVEIAKRLPNHASVLRMHPTWFSAELFRVRDVLFPLHVEPSAAMPLGPGME